MSLMNLIDKVMGGSSPVDSPVRTKQPQSSLLGTAPESTGSSDKMSEDDSEAAGVYATIGNTVQVRVPVLCDPQEYQANDDRPRKIIQQVNDQEYIVQTRDNRQRVQSKNLIQCTKAGRQALAQYYGIDDESSSEDITLRGDGSRGANTIQYDGNQNSDVSETSGSGSDDMPRRSQRATRLRSSLRQGTLRTTRHQAEASGSDDSGEGSDGADDVESDEDEFDQPYGHSRTRRQQRRVEKPTRSTRVSKQPRVTYDFGRLSSDSDSARNIKTLRKRKRHDVLPTRRSERSNRRAAADMRERGEDDIDTVEIHKAVPKAAGAKEAFKSLPPQDEFRKRHCMTCDTCGHTGNSSERGELIFCQGCSTSYHKICIGHRKNRDHLVTKVGDGDFVLQCRRCVEFVRTRESTAPHQARCAVCKQAGDAAQPFRIRTSPAQEQKDREKNGGQDPVQIVSQTLVNNVKNVLFRCRQCFQAFHMYHLEPKQENPLEGQSISQKASSRFSEYSTTWTCHMCDSRPTPPVPNSAKATVGALIAWRPTQDANYQSGQTVEEVEEDEKEYLVKWSNMSHYSCRWMPGPWVWGVTNAAMRKAFANRNNAHNYATMRTEDAIPEDWLRIDIIFSVKYTNLVQAQIEEVDIARIKEVGRVYVKFAGLTHEESVWTDPPDVEEKERYEDFKTAYIDYVRGKYIRAPTQKRISNELQKLRVDSEDQQKKIFQKKVLLKEQPAGLLEGTLMDYQLEGINWLLYQWQFERNAILADEMGLGKTIQVIGFMAALKERHSLWPFLVVVPNATCANWRREIKKWAPHMRVITYFGSERARTLAMEHELFGDREGPTRQTSGDLRCHVVVTSYEAASDPTCQPFFKRINWQALVIDEGQRLKSDKTILYWNLLALKAPFRLLMTGTPLQNNQRELFNLLQFLDRKHNAAELDEEFQDLNEANVKRLHDMVRPYFLRRTKAQVLTFLPPMGQVIVPVTMSTLQRTLYKNILGRNAELLRSIMSKRESEEKRKAIAGLRNVLVQLRKCLCHPFVYSIEVEERTDNAAVSHRRLVAASPKLSLLEKILPKLRERGHRVLLFSQFLNMLTVMEDFLDGMELSHLRLDGSQSSLQKQDIIDKYNDPNSSIFAMLLSTRAGGVGINLATADTVIILDPDFNPHVDIQAISRAHRIGQKNKVLILKLMTRDSAEEKIMQVGKKKMVLDHIIVEQMEAEHATENDLESILAYGAQALFNDEARDIVYDDASVEKMLDRDQIKDVVTDDGEDPAHKSSFSFARVWQNDINATGEMQVGPDTTQVEPGVWDKIIAVRRQEAEAERREREAAMGRGKRARNVVNYGQGTTRAQEDNDSDTDFAAKESSDDDSVIEDAPEDQSGGLDGTHDKVKPMEEPQKPKEVTIIPRRILPRYKPPKSIPSNHSFVRVEIPTPVPPSGPHINLPCLACKNAWGPHALGSCPLKVAGPEYCNLCGLAHFGFQRTCPHLKSETQVRLLLDALRYSPEDPELVRRAREKLQGIKGALVQAKKRRAEAQAVKEARHTSQQSGVGTAPSVPDVRALPPAGPQSQNVQMPSVFSQNWTPMHNGPQSDSPRDGVGSFGQLQASSNRPGG